MTIFETPWSMRHVLLTAICLTVFCLAGLLLSATATAQDAPADSVWHRYFEYLAGENTGSASGTLPTPGRRGAASGSTVSFTPDGPEFSEQVLPPGELPPGYQPQSDDNIELDDDTSAPDALNYSRLFTPSIAPYKRLGVRDRIPADARSPELSRVETQLRELAIATAFSDGRQTFVGTMHIQSDGSPVPIPSPSPELQVHQASTDTGAEPTFFVDDSDALFVQLDPGTHELRFLSSSPLTYFGGPLPVGRTVTPAEPRPVFDPLADEVLRLAGVDRYDTDVEIVSALARYLHRFTPVEQPQDLPDDDLYLTLARRKEGVCRHRAFIFVTTLISVGVPARYVFNEAHAFAEVRLVNGWRRIELGGAAETLDVLGDTNSDRAFDMPSDELLPPDPMNMQSSEPNAEASAADDGSSDEGTDEGGESADSQGEQTSTDGATNEGPDGQQAPSPGPQSANPRQTESETPSGEAATGEPGEPGEPGENAAMDDPDAPTGESTLDFDAGEFDLDALQVENVEPEATAADEIEAEALAATAAGEPTVSPRQQVPSYLIGVTPPTRGVRNENLTISGQLVDDMQNPVSFQTISVLVETSGLAEGVMVATGDTDQSGYFRIEFALPASLPPGPAELVLRFEGTEVLAPAEFR
jgi:hypothetical protein